MARVELAEQRRDPVDADRIRRGEAQPAARAALQLADRALGFVEFARDALAVFEVDVAGLGQAELARGAMQELRAQARFQVLHLAADRGLGQAQRARRGNEAAVLDHLDEDQGVVEIAGHGDSGWERSAGWPAGDADRWGSIGPDPGQLFPELRLIKCRSWRLVCAPCRSHRSRRILRRTAAGC